jgi:hypothetical protein
MMAETSKSDKNAALECIAIIDGEKRLLGVITNEIRLAFDLEGAVKPAPLQNEVAWAPKEWFW